MSFHFYTVVFCATIPMARFSILQRELYPLNCTGKVFGALRPSPLPYTDER